MSTVPSDTYIRLVAENGTEADLIALGAVNLAKDPFPLAPVNEPAELRILADDEITGTATVEIHYYFRSV